MPANYRKYMFIKTIEKHNKLLYALNIKQHKKGQFMSKITVNDGVKLLT